MTVKRGGLGRNLSVLLGHKDLALPSEQSKGDQPLQLPLNVMQPGKYQPRSDIEEDSLAELADSIKQQGLLQPLIVREIRPDHYEIIAGERRWRASRLAGLSEVPVVIRQVDDETAMAIALVENLQREDLNAMDQARAMYRLTREFDLTHQQVADLLCKSRTAVSNFLRLLSLAEDVRRLLEYGDLDMGHARALLVLEEEQQSYVAKLVVAKGLSVRETEKLVKRVKDGHTKPAVPVKDVSEQVKTQLDQLAHHLRTKIHVKQGKSGKGSLIIHYKSLSDLESVIQQIITP
ncbi:ParB/RepB/Spo0J family partition protein [Legionella spiritensis]|uniref:ParB/RepB/Spo0J family partition protein n=1 Tax=Legionella spiritensis TaxID=452 RepID=UPI000F6CB9B9|nr:ParB/RepB/Spo0J family partition protein [Legionella spiritensis]VEG91683.1 chromosome partitioning protein ParB [Legionella spiritensis]